MERTAGEHGDEDVGLCDIVGTECLLDISVLFAFNIHYVKDNVVAHLLQAVETQQETFVELNEFQTLVGYLTTLLDIEFGGGYLVHLAEIKRHHQ